MADTSNGSPSTSNGSPYAIDARRLSGQMDWDGVVNDLISRNMATTTPGGTDDQNQLRRQSDALRASCEAALIPQLEEEMRERITQEIRRENPMSK